MGDKTGISWTDATWNPIVGCSEISPACKNCYAAIVASNLANEAHEKTRAKYQGLTTGRNKIRWVGKTRFVEDVLDQPVRWKRSRMIFVCSMSDLFHETVTDEQLDAIFEIMYKSHWHVFQLLTKRIKRAYEYLKNKELPDHIWVGATIEDQTRADLRIPYLVKIKAKIHFLSMEPLLGPVDLSPFRGIDWIIVGGESGFNVRRMDLDWVRDILKTCRMKAIPFKFKQLGSVIASELGARSPKGEDFLEWPEDLQVQEFPDFNFLESEPDLI